MAGEEIRRIMNISPTMMTANLDTVDSKGNRESLIMTPREARDVTLSQFNSTELQKLLSAKLIVSITAANERRVQREREMGITR